MTPKLAKLEAQLLLQHALNVNRAWLIVHEHENLAPSIEAAYRAMLKRRLNGEPIAYILGCREFYGLNLKVTAGTLIHRADTETLVEVVLAKVKCLLSPYPQPLSCKRATGFNSLLHSPRSLAGEGRCNAEDEGQYKNSRLRH